MQLSVMELVLPRSILAFLSSYCRRRVDCVDNSRAWHKRRDGDGTVPPFRGREYRHPPIYLIQETELRLPVIQVTAAAGDKNG